MPDGAPVPRFAFGTMQFGGGADEAASRAMYEAARAAGITHFDTAYGYTGGESERLLGRFAAAERDRLYIATKCAWPLPASRANITAQFDESRRRLGMDMVDLLYLHRWDAETPLEETFETMARLVEAGHVRHVGVSNYAAWQVMKAASVAARFGLKITAIQPMYSLVKRTAEVEIFPMALSEGFAVMTYSPLGGGLLTGKYARGETGRLLHDAAYARRYGDPTLHKVAERLAAIAGEMGVSPAMLAVAWAARHPAVTGPILSARTPEQLAPSLAAIAFDMDDALYARLSQLVPAPPPATDRTEEA
ncbi:aldo/keto reductase [Meinhardsimonia xiamenensis]|jgi:aryl-alcohol dehydrogenase-like predicted oxidoreductase